ncbi:signal peptidase I [Halorubrum sp. Boch-26]|uniref:signal peptidase I n=1 Tax=Halorubrum sp. Boch-26 TaxID=2994426 RepID=UPI002469854F|nr:signal peptidase I [Halorubrum sp. Boch-26]
MIHKAGIAVGLLVLVALALPAGAPVQISYVSSDSMSPTIDTDEGYVLVPVETVQPGDVITFYSEERSTYVTHRATQVTPDGIVTKGDGNPSTDQASGYSLVSPSDVSGKLLTLGGSLVVIPYLGTVIGAITSYWYLVAGALAAYLLTSSGSDRRRTRKNVLRSREVVLPVLVLVIVVSVAFVSMGAVGQTEVYTVTEQPTPLPSTLTVGESETESISLQMTTSPFAHVVTEAHGMEIVRTTLEPGVADGSQPPGEAAGWLPWQPFESSSRTVETRITAPETAGSHSTSIRIHPYPATLPEGIITLLHEIHPLVAAIATVVTGVLPLYVIYWLLVDSTVPLRSSRSRLERTFGGRR